MCIHFDAYEVNSVYVSGQSAIVIPAEGEKTLDYEAIVQDKNLQQIHGEEVTWSVENVDGSDVDTNVSINEGTGQVTVTSDATAQANSFKVIATSVTDPTISGDLQVSLEEEEFAGGDGTSENPWEIATAQQLNNVRGYLGEENDDKHFILVDNIDLTSYGEGYDEGKGWEPLGASGNPFAGNFDGDNYTINNLYIDRPGEDFIGLFGQTKSAVIKKLGLVDVDITGQVSVGGLVGEKGSNVGENNGLVSGCYVAGSVNGQHGVGGLIGQSYDNSIDSYSTAEVTGTNNRIGGLVGSNYADIEDSYATGDVNGSSSSQEVGGLVGKNDDGVIKECFAKGDVSGQAWVGGLVGADGGRILYSYATGKATGIDVSSNIGGLVGELGDGADMENSYASGTAAGDGRVGGLVGNNRGNITNSYSVGSVVGTGSDPYDIGGLVGHDQDTGETVNSYWDKDASEQTESAVGEGKTTNEMLQETTFTDGGWDFDTVWGINPQENDGYPFLRWQGYEHDEDLSGATLAMETDPITEGDTAQVNVTNAQDAAGDAIDGDEVAVTVTSDQAEGVVFNDNVDFSNPAGEAQIITDSLNMSGTHTLTVSIGGVTEDQTVTVDVQ